MRVYLFRGLAIAHLIFGVMYISWRITHGIAGSELWLSLLFLLAEVFTLAATVGFFLSQIRQSDPIESPVRGSLHPLLPATPPVDVLIMRRWDSLEATRQTIKAVLQLKYPPASLKIQVIDLEWDEAMQQAAAAMGAGYIHCSPAIVDPLQYVLDQGVLQAEYVLLLEPGQFPDPDLLQQTLPFFYRQTETDSNSTGYVQAMLRALGHARSDHPLQQPIPLGQGDGEIAPLLGTGVVIRREALQGIERIDSRRPVLLGCLLHLQGWKSYLCRTTEVTGVLLPLRNRRVALLALLEALKQNPIGRGKTSQIQRFQYLWLGFWSMSGVASLLYFGIPVIFLWTGLAPVPAFDTTFFRWFLPYLLSGGLAWWASFPADQRGSAWRAARQTGAQFFQSIQAIIQSIHHEAPYREKASQLSVGPQGIVIVVTLLGILVGCIHYAQGWDITLAALGFSLLWALYNLALVTIKPPDFDLSFLGETDPELPDEGLTDPGT